MTTAATPGTSSGRTGLSARGRVAPALAWALCCCLLGAPAAAQEVALAEEVQAAYLHKFAGYVEWPPPRAVASAAVGGPILIGVVGADGTAEQLALVAGGRAVHGRAVEVRRPTAPEDATGLHLVFIGRGAWTDLPAWVNAARGRGLLVVTDAPRGLERGATLALVRVGDRLRFEASLPAAETAGLKLSSRLLAVAERVVAAAP